MLTKEQTREAIRSALKEVYSDMAIYDLKNMDSDYAKTWFKCLDDVAKIDTLDRAVIELIKYIYVSEYEEHPDELVLLLIHIFTVLTDSESLALQKAVEKAEVW